jgi:hypothetical protein
MNFGPPTLCVSTVYSNWWTYRREVTDPYPLLQIQKWTGCHTEATQAKQVGRCSQETRLPGNSFGDLEPRCEIGSICTMAICIKGLSLAILTRVFDANSAILKDTSEWRNWNLYGHAYTIPLYSDVEYNRLNECLWHAAIENHAGQRTYEVYRESSIFADIIDCFDKLEITGLCRNALRTTEPPCSDRERKRWQAHLGSV